MATAKNGVMLALCNWKKKDMKKLTLAQAKQIDLVDYLASLGHYPDPKRSNSRDYWYLSPLPGRNEKTPSFKVDRKLNLWFDFGIGKGGSIIDFGMLYDGCTIPELPERLQSSFSFQRPYFPALPHLKDVCASGQLSPPLLPVKKKRYKSFPQAPLLPRR